MRILSGETGRLCLPHLPHLSHLRRLLLLLLLLPHLHLRHHKLLPRAVAGERARVHSTAVLGLGLGEPLHLAKMLDELWGTNQRYIGVS